PKLRGKALVQAHCHHKAVLHFDDEEQVLKKIGLDVDHPDSGCCGMAGAFGFERDKYELSMRVGERVLLPAVRKASRDTIIIADGFSCREQIAQSTGREALHIAQVLHLAMQKGAARDLPERSYEEQPATLNVRKMAWKAAGIAGGIALLAGVVALLRRWRRRKTRDVFTVED
ncbi:MAG TPA: FAD-binding oxidoreductase, partial [Thermoanaerobaculia bacterium]